jgi:hypothetical protein
VNTLLGNRKMNIEEALGAQMREWGFSVKKIPESDEKGEKRSAAGKERGIPANLKKAIIARTKKKPSAEKSK